MQVLRKRYVIALATVGALAAGVAAASADSHSIIELRFKVTNMSPGTTLAVYYNGGVVALSADITRSYTGAVGSVSYFDGAILMSPSPTHPQPWSGDLEPFLVVDGASVTGVAHLPKGTSVTLTNVDTNQTIDVRDGPFSIPTGLVQRAATPRAGRTDAVRCRGTDRSCQARVSTAGDAPNRKTIIRLPARDLWLEAIKSFPRGAAGAAVLSDGHFARGRSEFVETLNTVQSEPRGSHLILTFGTFPGR